MAHLRFVHIIARKFYSQRTVSVSKEGCIDLYGLPRLLSGKESACNAGVRSLGWEGPLEKAMAPHSSTLAWKIPRTEEPGGLQSMGSQQKSDMT